MTDRRLIERAQKGDRAALTALVERHLRSALGFAFSLTRSIDRSEEIVQEAWAQALERLASLRDPDRFGAWLLTIVRRVAAAERRRQDRDERLQQGFWQRLPGDDKVRSDAVEDAETRSLVLDEVARLPESLRVPLTLFYFLDQSTRDVARALDLSPDTARKRIQIARDRLRDSLGERLSVACLALGVAAELTERIVSSRLVAVERSSTLAATGTIVGGTVGVGALLVMKWTATAAIALLLLLALGLGSAAWLGSFSSVASTSASPIEPAAVSNPAIAAAPRPENPERSMRLEPIEGSILAKVEETASGPARDGQSLRGRVLNQRDRSPVPGVLVRIQSPGTTGARETETDSGGRFLVSGLEAGRWILADVRSAPGSARAARGLRAVDWIFDSQAVLVTSSAADEVLLLAEPRFHVAGRVVDTVSRRPVPGVRLVGFHRSERVPFEVGTTDGAGGFRTRDGLKAGSVILTAGGLSRGLGETDDLMLTEIVVGEKHDTLHLELELAWTGRIRAVVLDDDEEPILGAVVFMLGEAHRSRQQQLFQQQGRRQLTLENGEASFDRLPLDRDLVMVTIADGFAPFVSGGIRASVDDSAPVHRMRLDRGGRVQGTIRTESGAPVDGATIRLQPLQPIPSPHAEVSEGGEFAFEHLAPGPYRIEAWGQDGRRLDGEPLNIGRETTRVDLCLPEREVSWIAGTVVDERGEPAPNRVFAFPIGNGEVAGQVQSDDSGFRFEHLEPGSYRLVVAQPGLCAEPLVAETGTGDHRLVVSELGQERLTVRVVDTDRRPLPGAEIYLLYDEAPFPAQGVTNTIGEWAWRQLAARRYEVWAAARGHAPRRSGITVQPGAGAHELTIVLEPGRSADGRVVDAAGEGVAGALVCLLLPLEHHPIELGCSTVACDSEGRFHIEGLPLTEAKIGLLEARRSRVRPSTTVSIDAPSIVLVAPR